MSSSYKSSTLVISSSDKNGGVLLVGVDEVLDQLNGVVPLEDFVKVTDGIVGVSGVIDSGSLDHEEETLVAAGGGELEGLESGSSHLGEGGFHRGVSVDLVRHVSGGEDTHERQGSVVSAVESVESSSGGEEVVA